MTSHLRCASADCGRIFPESHATIHRNLLCDALLSGALPREATHGEATHSLAMRRDALRSEAVLGDARLASAIQSSFPSGFARRCCAGPGLALHSRAMRTNPIVELAGDSNGIR